MLRFGTIGAFAAAFLVLSSPALAAYNAYLLIEGVPGESRDDQHRGWIEVLSFERKAGGMRSMSSGAGAGNTGSNEIVITKRLDASSPMLRQAASAGRRFSKAVLDVMKPGAGAGTRTPYMEITFTDVLVSGVSMASGVSGSNETVTLSYAHEETSYAQATASPQTMRRPMNAMPMMHPVSPPH